jgi:hypothetical protein
MDNAGGMPSMNHNRSGSGGGRSHMLMTMLVRLVLLPLVDVVAK